MGYDVIGDIHGQAGKLEALLRRLGYAETRTGWVPPHGRQAVFLGDLIDRGPEQVKVVNIVRAMIDANHAHSVMGNHEFNAIGYATERRDAPGEFLRPHNTKNMDQHVEFLRQVGEGSALHHEMIEWFKSLPPALDLGGIRVVHAWWHQPHVDLVASRIQTGVAMGDDFLHASYTEGSPDWQAMEGLTKGLELRLPEGESFVDHGGVERHEVRAKWWNDGARGYRDVAIMGLSCWRPARCTFTLVKNKRLLLAGLPLLNSSNVHFCTPLPPLVSVYSPRASEAARPTAGPSGNTRLTGLVFQIST